MLFANSLDMIYYMRREDCSNTPNPLMRGLSFYDQAHLPQGALLCTWFIGPGVSVQPCPQHLRVKANPLSVKASKRPYSHIVVGDKGLTEICRASRYRADHCSLATEEISVSQVRKCIALSVYGLLRSDRFIVGLYLFDTWKQLRTGQLYSL